LRYFIELSYNGTDYHGWQLQKNALTVQQVVNTALETVLRYPIETVGSGRTDAGVHAFQQFCHVDLNQVVDTGNVIYKLNSLLPNDIVIRSMLKVSDSAHARFDAVSRSYQYHISTTKDPFGIGMSYYFRQQISVPLITEACSVLLGEKNFKSFCKRKASVDHYNCCLTEACWEVNNDKHCFHVSANRFLRGMVRALVGTLLDVGTEKINLDQFQQVISAEDRRQAGRAVPPGGLFLTKVVYPDEVLNKY
jgi:tRNA pseudouridine38-40 synthase